MMRLLMKYMRSSPCVNICRGRQRRTSLFSLIVFALSIHLWWHLQQGDVRRCSIIEKEEEDYGMAQKELCRNKTDRSVVGCSANGQKIFHKDDARVLGTGLPKKGLPTIERNYKNKTVSYLEQTLDSLIEKLSPKEMSEVHIVIFLADLNERARETVKQKLWAKYQKYIDDNIINAIQAPNEFYPKLKGLVRTYGDSQERMFWRSKQTMDYVFLFNYCESLSDYYLQMEDDVKTAKDFLNTVKTCMNRFEDEKWAFIQTSIWGFIGKLFKNDELNYFSRMLRIFYNDIPCDWLLHRYPTWRGDNATVADRICGNIFTHIGDQSSSLGT